MPSKKKTSKKKPAKKAPSKKASKTTPARKKTSSKKKASKTTLKAGMTAYQKRKKELQQTVNWRTELEAQGNTKFTDERKELYCKVYAKTGRMADAALAAGVNGQTVRNHLQADKTFALLFEEAKDGYKARVHKVVEKVALDGVLEPIVGGKFKDRIVAHKRVYATNILAMEMKRTNPEYKEKTEIDVTMQSRVLMVNAPMSKEEWMAKYAKPVPDSDGETYTQGVDY